MSKGPVKIEVIRFAVDSNLMYLIQSITKKPTQDILGYFYSTALTLTEEGMKHTVASYLRRKLDFFYPDTTIPFKLEIQGDMVAAKVHNKIQIYVSVQFPKKTVFKDVTDMIALFTEVGLGLVDGEELPAFEKPKTTVPRGMKNKI